MNFWEDIGNRAAVWTLVVVMPLVLGISMWNVYRDPTWRRPARREKLPS